MDLKNSPSLLIIQLMQNHANSSSLAFRHYISVFFPSKNDLSPRAPDERAMKFQNEKYQ